MTQLISASTFASAFQDREDLAQHASIWDDDGKICTLSHQLFSLKKLVKSNPQEMKFYKGIAKQIFIEKYGIKKRDRLDRLISAIGNFFMGRGLKSSDYMLKKILRANTLTVTKEQKPFIALAPHKFINKILESADYSAPEKALLAECTEVYADNGKPIHKKIWLGDDIICSYFRWLALKNPEKFGTLAGPNQSYYYNEIENKDLNDAVDMIVTYLPTTLNNGPALFAQPIRLKKNHHTVFVIDLENRTIEYYNSFGSDSKVKGALEKLKNELGIKYGKSFIYQHKTENIRQQYNSYDCGVWACLNVEERIKQKTNFDPGALKTDISKYRKRVYAHCFKLSFYNKVGKERVDRAYTGLNQDEYTKCIDDAFNATKKGFEPFYYGELRKNVESNELQAIIANAIKQASGQLDI